MYIQVLAADEAVAVADAEWAVPLWGILAGLILAALVVVWLSDATTDLADEVRKGVAAGTAQGLAPAAKWKIGDSWASDLTALTTAVAALAAALSDELAAVIDPGATATYALGGALLLAVAAVAPPAYATLQRYQTGRMLLHMGRGMRRISPERHDAFAGEPGALVGSYRGLLTAAFLTLTSVFGSLAMTGVLVQVGITDAPVAAEALTWLAVAAVMILFAAYAVRTITWLLLDALKEPESGSTLAGTVSLDCCGPDRPAPTRRALLL